MATGPAFWRDQMAALHDGHDHSLVLGVSVDLSNYEAESISLISETDLVLRSDFEGNTVGYVSLTGSDGGIVIESMGVNPLGYITLRAPQAIFLQSDNGGITFTDSVGALTLAQIRTRLAGAKGFVNHGATAGTARPTGYASIEWYGSVEPTNAIDGDTWIDTSA